MRTVCITGHRPDVFLQSHYDLETAKRIANDTMWLLKQEYKDELELCLGGAIGADQYAGAAAIEHEIRYRMFLPFLPEIQAKFWNKSDKLELDRQLQHAAGITIVDPNDKYDIGNYYKRDKEMVDNSDFVVAFWAGKRRGGTYLTIKYALSQSKFVLNALNELRPIFSNDLKKGWTPQKR
jgi:uncharacterized phage-like protein YoqJ